MTVAIKIEKKTEFFNTRGQIKAESVFIVRDPESGSLLFVFRLDAGRWVMTQDEPYSFCVGAQSAPDRAEFPMATSQELEILEESFNQSHDLFLEKLTALGVSVLRKRVSDLVAEKAAQAAKKAAIAAELSAAEKADRSDLSSMNQIPAASGWKLSFPDDEKDRLILESQRGTLEIAEFRVSGSRRRVEFRLLKDGIDLDPSLSPEKWVNPWMFKLDLLPLSLKRIIAPTFQALSGGLSQILPEPRLPKEVQGYHFKGKGLSYLIKQIELNENYIFAGACIDAYGNLSTSIGTALEPIWVIAKKVAMARKLANMGHLWSISHRALSYEAQYAAKWSRQGINDLFPTPDLPIGVYGFRIHSDPGFRVLTGYNWDAWLASIS